MLSLRTLDLIIYPFLLLQWLNEKQLIEKIIGLLNDRYDRDTHDNASRLLIEILRVSRDGQVRLIHSTKRATIPLVSG